jgi:hypothetical protein|tara:strand:- start:1165 stop:1428 length:264 start_codon:yes stop_codon:yes gene_type:complete
LKGKTPVNIGVDGIQRSKANDVKISLDVAELFSTPTGQSVLNYLKSITIQMVHGPEVTTEALRHHEGQRYISALIDQRIAHAHRSKK